MKKVPEQPQGLLGPLRPLPSSAAKPISTSKDPAIQIRELRCWMVRRQIQTARRM